MIRLLRRFNPLRLLALLFFLLPMLALLVLGILWLWEHGALLYWIFALLIFGVLAWLMQWRMTRKRGHPLLEDAAARPNPEWTSEAAPAWEKVNRLAESLDAATWPLNDGDRMLTLGRTALETVARHYHPKEKDPELELTVPHALLIIERASRDIRHDILHNIPFSHRLTVGDVFKLQRWKSRAEKLLDIYRLGRVFINPVNALINEMSGKLREDALDATWDELHLWLLRAYVRKIGYYAIDLYSGHLLLEDIPPDFESHRSRRDLAAAGQTGNEPLRILLLGRANAGKSSLINALFGALTCPADILPDAAQELTPCLLERDGFTRALVFDSPGLDSPKFNEKILLKAIADADLILWVTPANRPDRQIERDRLQTVRAALAASSRRHPPRIIVALTHIDQLRPAGQWHPPYDLNDGTDAKAVSIREALRIAASELSFDMETMIPVCTAKERLYNIDTFWSAILTRQDDALRTRLLRCRTERKKAENREILRKQFASTGKSLLRWTGWRRGKKPD